MYYGISIKEIEKIEICSLMPLHLSKNIPEYQKNLKFSIFREIEQIYLFCAKNSPYDYIDKNWIKFSPKLQDTTSFS